MLILGLLFFMGKFVDDVMKKFGEFECIDFLVYDYDWWVYN